MPKTERTVLSILYFVCCHWRAHLTFPHPCHTGESKKGRLIESYRLCLHTDFLLSKELTPHPHIQRNHCLPLSESITWGSTVLDTNRCLTKKRVFSCCFVCNRIYLSSWNPSLTRNISVLKRWKEENSYQTFMSHVFPEAVSTMFHRWKKISWKGRKPLTPKAKTNRPKNILKITMLRMSRGLRKHQGAKLCFWHLSVM